MRLIDADLVIDTVNEFKGKNRKTDLGIKLVEEIVSNAPTVDAERHGYWIYITDPEIIEENECSLCHTQFFEETEHYRYCPHCGAKMDAKGE